MSTHAWNYIFKWTFSAQWFFKHRTEVIYIQEQELSFVRHEDKSSIAIGFAKDEFCYHKGIDGLRYYLVIPYLRKYMTTFGEIRLSIDDMVAECGYSTNSRSSKVHTTFRQILQELSDSGYILTDVDLLDIKRNSYFKIKLPENKNIFFSQKQYVVFTIREFETIVNSGSRCNTSLLAGVYLSIKKNIFMNNDLTNSLQIAFPSKYNICKELGMSSMTSVESAINELANLGLLFIRSNLYIADYKNADQFIAARNIYALDKKHLSGRDCIKELEHRCYESNHVFTRDELPEGAVISYLTKI